MSLVTAWTAQEDNVGSKMSQAQKRKMLPSLNYIERRGAEGAEEELGGE